MELTNITINNRYRLIRKLSEGTLSDYYEAMQINSDPLKVIVRIISNSRFIAEDEELIKIKRDLRIISSLNHPNIMKILDFGEIFKLPYIVMEYAPGKRLLSYLKNSKATIEQSLEIIIQITRALVVLHQNGVVHKGLNPDRIHICPDQSPQNIIVKLKDIHYPHIRDIKDQELFPDDSPDYFEYFSPEQLNPKNDSIDQRSDLYSLGVLFYRLVTGNYPYSPYHLLTSLHNNNLPAPEKPRAIDSQIDTTIEAIILKLISADWASRYHSAIALLYDLEKYIKGERNFSPGICISGFKRDYTAEFNGRIKEYNRLIELLHYSENVNGCICIVNGESGTGKTRLIEEFLSYARMKNTTIISGKCTSGVKKEPYSLIRELLNSYIKTFNSHPDILKEAIRKTLKGSLGILGEIILKLNHNMSQIIGNFPDLVRINPEYENSRFHSVAVNFFHKLAVIEKSIIIAVDDLQWIDESSIELLTKISADIKNSNIFLIGAFRNDEFENTSYIQSFIKTMESDGENYFELKLEALDKSDTKRIISSILYNCQNIIEDLSSFLQQKSNGNPFFLIEILRSLIDEKIIMYTPAGWELDSLRLDQIKIPPSITDIMIKKISLLGDMEMLILSHASLIGNTFEYDLLSKLFFQLNPEKFSSIMENCVNLQFIYRDSQRGELFHFVHNRVREALSTYINPDEKIKIHSNIALILETTYKDKINEAIFDITNHYIECNNSEKILQYALTAAYIASDTFANQDAVRYYLTVIDIIQKNRIDDNSESLKLWIEAKTGLANIYLRTEHYDDSIKILNELIPYINNPEIRVLQYSMISTAYFKKGDLKCCELYARIGIDELGEKLPDTKKSLLFSFISEVIVHIFYTSLSFIPVKREQKEKNIQKQVLVLYEILSLMYTIKNRHKYLWVTLRILNIAERYPKEDESNVKALYLYGILLATIGLFKPSFKYLNKSHYTATRLNNPYLMAVSSMYIGNNYEWQGQFIKAIGYYNEAQKYFERIGNSTGVGYTFNGLSSCYLHMSDNDKLTAVTDKYYDLSTKVQNIYMMCNSLIYKTACYIIKGDFDMAMIHARKAHSTSTELNLQMAQCVSNYFIATVYYYKNELDKAISYYETSISLYEKHRFIKYYTFQAYPLLIEALIALYKNSENDSKINRKQLLAKIKKYNRVSLRNSEYWPTIRQYSLLSSAKFYAMMGKNTKAEKYFLKSINLSTQLGMKFESARSIYEYALFLLDIGNTVKGKRELEFSYTIFREIGSDFYADRVKKKLGLKNAGKNSLKIKQIVYNKKLELIDKLILDISQITENDKIVSEFVRNAAFIAGVQLGCLYIFNDNLNPELIATYGTFNYNNPEFHKTSSETLHSGSPVTIINNVNGDIFSFLFLPVNHQGKTISVCAFGADSSKISFGEDDIKLLSGFVNKISWLLNFVLDQYKNNLRSDDLKPRITAANEEKIKKVISYIRENYMFDISREGLAALIDSNPDYFGRSFKLYTGLKISEYINKVRVEEAAKRLTNTNNKILDIALSVGFENLGTFNNSFLKIMKMIPSKYRKQKSVYDMDITEQ